MSPLDRGMIGIRRMDPRGLLVIRHASPKIEPDVPPDAWHLSTKGHRDTWRLADKLQLASHRIWSSEEPKAKETAAILAASSRCEVAVHRDLREVRFDAGFLSRQDFEARVASYLEGAGDPAFEPYAAAQRRIVACVEELGRLEEGDLVIVSHGRIITVLLSAVLGRRLGAPAWRQIRMPDWTLLDLGKGEAVAGFATNL